MTIVRSPHCVARASAITGASVVAILAPRIMSARSFCPLKFTTWNPSASMPSKVGRSLECCAVRSLERSADPVALSAASPAKRGAFGAGRVAGISSDAHAANRHAPSTCCHTPRRGAGSEGSCFPLADSVTFTRHVTTNASPTRVARTPLTFGAVTPRAAIAATSAARSKDPSKLIR